MQLSEMQDHPDLGTTTHRWNQPGAPDPSLQYIKPPLNIRGEKIQRRNTKKIQE